MSVLIKYGDVATGAREHFEVTTENQEYFSKIDQIQKNIVFPKYQNPIDLYSVLLDGGALLLPSNYENANVGFWSDEISDGNGVFADPILIQANANEFFISPGITLVFDEENDIFPTQVTIEWLRDGEIIDSGLFYPDSANYFFEKKVEFYNGLRIYFHSLNMPHNRLRIKSIEYGLGTQFSGEEIKSVKIKQEINPISSEISINTCDFVISPKRDTEFSFQERQPCEIYSNDQFIMTAFVKNFKKSGDKFWSVSAEDYIGIMEDVVFYGGIYVKENAFLLLEKIFNTAKIPYSIDETYKGVSVSGYIKYGSCRDALMQVAFAISAVVDTSYSSVVRVFPLSVDISQTIEKKRVMLGQSYDRKSRVTSVEVSSHAYLPTEKTIDVYNADENGTGENVHVVFREPLHGLSISNGTIKESGANYAIIDALDGCILKGKTYDHTIVTKEKRNPYVTLNDTENIVSVQNATLVSKDNVDKLLEKCYNYLVNSKKRNMKIVDGKHVKYGGKILYGQKKYGTFLYGEKEPTIVTRDKPSKVGDLVIVPINDLQTEQLRITKQSFSIIGGITVKDTILE